LRYSGKLARAAANKGEILCEKLPFDNERSNIFLQKALSANLKPGPQFKKEHLYSKIF